MDLQRYHRESNAAGGSPGSAWWATLPPLLAAAVYARTVTFGWAFDDHMEIVRNVTVHSLGNVGQMFGTTVWAGSGMESYLYRPLTLVSYALNYAASGVQPWSYHLVNVALFAGTSLLIVRVGRVWGLSAVATGIGALLFAVHPVHVEVVANVSGRKDLLAAVFVLGMALAHRHAIVRGGWRTAMAAALYAGAALSKEIGVMGLFLVAAQDVFLERDVAAFARRPRVLGVYGAYVGVLGAYLLVRVVVTGAVGVPETSVFDNPLVDAGTASRLATALVVMGKGMTLLVAPLSQSPDYSFDAIPVVRSVADWRLVAAAAGCGLVAWGLARRSVRRDVLALALAWYLLALLPASNLLVTTGTIFGERLLYLPSVAFCLAVGHGVTRVGKRRLVAAVAGVVVVALAIGTVRYAAAWSDDITLFEWATRTVPRSTKAHHKLGEEYLRAGRLGDALRSLDRAVEIAPDNPFAAATRARARRLAVERFGGDGPVAPEVDDPDVLYVLGQSRMAQGDSAGALARWQAAVRADSTHAPSLADLGAARLHAHDALGAAQYLERAVASDSGLASAWFNLATIRLAEERPAEAAIALDRFIRAAGPRYPEQVAWARARLRQLGLPDVQVP